VRTHPTPPPAYAPEPPISGHVRGPKLEVQRAESGGRGFSRRGLHAGFVGSAVSSPSWVRGTAPAAKMFSCIL